MEPVLCPLNTLLAIFFPGLPSQLAALSRPTPQQTQQPIRGRLSILAPPPPTQSPGLQNSPAAGEGIRSGPSSSEPRDFTLKPISEVVLLYFNVTYKTK